MSIVSVHGPNMWGGTGAGGGGTGAVITAPQVQATADMDEGLKFYFEATDKTRVAADYDWAFPGGTPATATDNKGPITVTYATGGAKIATLTIAAGAGPPAGGAYPITVQALTAGPRSLAGGDGEEGGSDEGATPPPIEPEPAEPEPAPEAEAYDPGEHTVAEVTEHAQTLDEDGVKALIKAEEEGKERTTLLSALNELLPFDPGEWTVQEVQDYVEAYPEEREAALEAERAGKNRSTLVTWLETPPEPE